MTAKSSAAIEYWTLHNHPDALAGAPGYGLRLNGFGGFENVTVDFNSGFVTLAYDDIAETIRIQGSASGGSVVGASYDAQTTFLIDFTFSSKISVIDRPSRDRFGLKVRRGGYGLGTITPTDHFGTLLAGVSVEFQPKSNDGYSFKFNNFNNYRLRGTGLSGPDLFVGWGWLQESGQMTAGTKDWLFTGERLPNLSVPEPNSFALWSLFGLVVSCILCRRRQCVVKPASGPSITEHHARTSLNTFPWTSVRRNSRPWNL